MRIKIPRFIWIMIQAVVRMFKRYESLESRHQRMVATVVRETYDDLVLCLKLYLWEEKTGVPHPYTLEEISKVFRTRLQDIQAILGILRIRYQTIDDIERALTQAYA